MNDMPVFGSDPVTTKTALEDIAIETGTPIEVLFAAGEQAGAETPEDFLNIARQRGQEWGPRFKGGEDATAIVTELFGEEAQNSFGDYATEVRAQLYGTPTVQERNQADLEDDGFVDTLKRRGQQFMRGATEPFASLPEAKAIAQAQTDDLDTPASEIEGFDSGQRLRDATTDTFGAPNPEDRSFWAMVAEGAGNLVGMGGASLAAGLAGTAVAGPIGGVVAGVGTGGAVGSAMTSSQLYREAQDMGADEATAERAARWGAAIGATEIVPLARAFKFLPQGVRNRIGNGVMKRFADVAQSSGEEAAQEYLATVAQNMVAQQLYDPDRGWTEGATEGALVGAVLGAGAGAVGAGVDSLRGRQPQPLPDAGNGQGAVPPGGATGAGMVPPVSAPREREEQGAPSPMVDALAPPPASAADPAMQAPSPMADATASAPTPILAGFSAEQPVQIKMADPETGEISDPISAIFVGEDTTSGFAQFRAEDGSEIDVDLKDVTAGNLFITPALAEDAVTAPSDVAADASGFNLPIPQGVDPDVFIERVAIRQADGMSEQEAYQTTIDDVINEIREDVGTVADDVQERQREDRENASRIDEAAFTDGNGQPVIFPTQKVAESRLGAGYTVEPFGGGFIGVRKIEGESDAGSIKSGVQDGQGDAGPDVAVAGADPAGIQGGPATPQGSNAGTGGSQPADVPVAGTPDATNDAPDADATLTPEATLPDNDTLIKIAADDVSKLRGDDVYRVLSEAPEASFEGLSDYIEESRPDLRGYIYSARADIAEERGTDTGGAATSTPETAPATPATPEAATETTETATDDQKPVNKEGEQKQDLTPEGAETAPASQETDPKRAAVRAGIASGEVTHTTKRGKVLTGYVVKGFKPADMADVDKYRFVKDGGVFIRKDRAEEFLGDDADTPVVESPSVSTEQNDADQNTSAESEGRKQAITDINKAVTAENDDGGGTYLSGPITVQLDVMPNDVEITVTNTRSRYKGRVKETRENTKSFMFKDVRDDLGDTAFNLISKYGSARDADSDGDGDPIDQLAKNRAQNAKNDADHNAMIDALTGDDAAARDQYLAAFPEDGRRELQFAARDGRLSDFLQRAKTLLDANVVGYPEPSSNLMYRGSDVAEGDRFASMAGKGPAWKGGPTVELQVLAIADDMWINSASATLPTGGSSYGLSSVRTHPSREAAIQHAAKSIMRNLEREKGAKGVAQARRELQAWLDSNQVEMSTDPKDVDAAAAEADPNPTDAQKEAGNYKKGHVVWNDMHLTIENAKGSERSGTDQDGETWSVTMPAHYGYFKMTEGADGEHVDFYMGEAPDADYVMWIDQADANTGKFDEHKIMVGFPSRGAALAAYRGAFNDGRGDERIGGMFEGTVNQLKAWLDSTLDTNFDSTKPINSKLDFPFKKPAASGTQRDTAQNVPAETDVKPSKGALVPINMERLKAVDFDDWDSKTREDGQMSPAKRAGRDETGRWARALVKTLKDMGFEASTNSKGKPEKQVSFDYEMASNFDGTSVRMKAPNGLRLYVSIRPAMGFSKADVFTMLVQYNSDTKNFIGGNKYLDENMTPFEAAQQLAKWADGLGEASTPAQPSSTTDRDLGKAGRYWDGLINSQQRALIEKTVGKPSMSGLKWAKIGDDAQARLANAMPDNVFAEQQADTGPSWASVDESSDNDPKMPSGWRVLTVKRLTRKEASDLGAPWPSVFARIKAQGTGWDGTYGEHSDVSRAEAISKALDNANQAKAQYEGAPVSKNDPKPERARETISDFLSNPIGEANVKGRIKPNPMTGRTRHIGIITLPDGKTVEVEISDDFPSGGDADWSAKTTLGPMTGAQVLDGEQIADLTADLPQPETAPAEAPQAATEPEAAAPSPKKGDKVLVKFTSPDREEKATVIDGPFKTDVQGQSYQVMIDAIGPNDARGSVLVPWSSVRLDPNPEAAPAKPAKQSLSSLSKKDQDRAALLRARIADRLKNQMNSGVDPAILQDAIELTGLYIKDGFRKFRALLDQVAGDMGLTPIEAEAWVRAGYTQARDNLDLDGEDVSDMDDGAAVVAEVRKLRAEAANPAPQEELENTAESDTIAQDGQETADEQLANQGSDQGESQGSFPINGMDGERSLESEPADDGGREGDEDSAGEPAGNEPSGSVVDRPGSVSDGPREQRKGVAPPNFVITDDFALGEGTDGQKLAANMEALRLVRALEAENRYATPEEQQVLARWVGWGGLKTVFDDKHQGKTDQWGRAHDELRSLLSTSEYVEAMRSANDAHYTARNVVKAMWRAMRNFGFEGGRALEPTVGSGNFLGLQPADLSQNTEWYAAEMDPVTGLISKHLYPQAQVFDGMGFQDAPFRSATFDVAIGNPPFGADMIGNKKLHPDLGKMKVHNFIIAKTGQLLREGGVMSMVVTHRFLDTPNPEARKALAPDFKFLGAIRLPNTAFEENANTQVTTDIVFFQKRQEGEADGDTNWLETGVEGPNGTRLNGYFAANPEMILGRSAMDGTMYAGGRKKDGKGEYTVHADGRDLDVALNEAVDKIKATIPNREQALEAATTAQDTSSTLPYGAMTLAKDGRIYRGEMDAAGNRVVEEVSQDSFWKDAAEAQGRLVQALADVLSAKGKNTSMKDRMDADQRARDAAVDAGLVDLAGDPLKQTTKYEQALSDHISNLIMADRPSKAAKDALTGYQAAVNRKRLGTDGFERLSAMLDLRQKTRELIALERADGNAQTMESKRRKLRDAYRAFRKSYGYLNSSKNEAILRGDVGPEFALELGYKAANKDGRKESASEAAILDKRVIYPHKLPDSVESVSDGLHVSMQERGYVDPSLIAELTSKTVEDVVAELNEGAEPLAFRNPKTGHYEIAEVYLSGNLAERISDAERAGLYQNVPHLKNAMPPPKTQDQITPSIRSLWIPPSVFNDFLRAMGYSSPSVTLLEKAGMSSVSASGTTLSEFGQQFATDRITAVSVFEHALKGKIPVIYDTIRTPDGDKRVKNETATREAVAAYEKVTKEFPEWAYANPERAGQIIDAFNEKMNVVTERKYEGVRYLRMVGNSPQIDLRNSQKNGAWRMIQDRMTLLHHVVGAGKTFTAIAGIMERKRMGLTRKAVVAVPNHLTGQWGREWLELYPAANILVPTERDFEPANRAKLINRIATGDFDAVIIGHSQLTKIENDPEIAQKYINDQIEELNAALQEAKASGSSKRTVGQIGTRLKKLKEKLQKLVDKLAENTDTSIIGWKDLGVDYLTVDEAHLFKNLEYTTTATNLVGMNPPGGSNRAFDMLMKIRTLQEMSGGGVAFLTGTPVSNSLVEIYSMMKYLIPDSLDAMNIKSFDAWKSAFIQDESRFEYTASMQLKERNIMAGMINLGPLAQLYRSFTDIVMRPDVERMFTEQKEAENAKQTDPAKMVSTRFPTPKVKGGERRINLAPPTETMKEFVRYLVMRMAGIKANKSNKDYMSLDNALWVLTDARKASVDIRTIDPTLGREEGSKVDRASGEVFRIWQENDDRKGAQMVFSDMSAPTKNASKDATRVLKAAYEKIGLKKETLKARIEADAAKSYAERWADVVDDIDGLLSSPDTDTRKIDSLNKFIESEAAQDAPASMFTADTGFSFYDDMKSALIEKGMPEDQIAFVHDYNTTAKKSELFEAVNEGKIRVLIGSTQKMGAGTNAQKRLVALHHIDAPWRPSDMEQREGRIIRQGNMFYAEDPEGFEVEIVAYSTEQTADVVQWQVLERKASSIETFMNATADTIVEEGGDADQYAEFMAQSTGKEIFLLKMQAEKTLDAEKSNIASTLRNLSEAKEFIKTFERNQGMSQARADAFGSLSLEVMGENAADYLAEWNAKVGAYKTEKARLEALADQIRERNSGKPRKEWEKLPEMPSAPVRWETRPDHPWEATIYDALLKAQSTPVSNQQKIKLNDNLDLEIGSRPQSGGLTEYYVSVVPSRGDISSWDINLSNTFGSIDAKDFRRSEKLLQALSPQNIMMRLEAASARQSNEVKRRTETLPKMQAIIDKGADKSGVDKAQNDLDRLSALVRIEEVKFADEAADAGPNYFAVRDDKERDLQSDKTAQPMRGQFQFKNAGQTYSSEFGAPNGTQRIEGTDRTGKLGIFEAENMDTGEPVVIEAIETQAESDDGPAVWDVLNVYDAMDQAGTPEAELKASRAKASFRRSPDARAQGAGDVRETMQRVQDEIERTVGRKMLVNFSRGPFDFGTTHGSIDGYFLDATIGVSLEAMDGPMGIARHEVIHALRSKDMFDGEAGAFTKKEWRALVAAARKHERLRAQIDQYYDGASETIKTEEVIAEMYREWSEGRDMELMPAAESAMQTLKRVLDAIINALRGNGLQTAADVFERVRSGEVGGRGPDGSGGGFDGDPVANTELMASISKMWSSKPTAKTDAALDKKEANFASNLLTNAMGASDQYNSLGLVPGEVLFRDLAKNMPSADKWVKTVRKMTSERQEMHAEDDVLAREWQGAYVKDKENGRKLHDLMHEATIIQIDPSEPFKAPQKPKDMTQGKYLNMVEDKRAEYADIKARYRQLPENMQSLFKRVRDAYGQFDEKLIDAMVDAVAKAMDLQGSRLKARFDSEVQQLKDDGIEGDKLKAEIRKARQKLNQDVKMLEFSRNARIRKMRLTHEANRLEGPYFPLMRFGQFFVAARNEKGKLVHFERATTAGAQNRIKAEMEEQGLKVEIGVMKPEDNMSRFVDPNFVADIQEALGEAALDGQILDAIYQRYLETLPSFSIRKANIHRQGMPGFDKDAIKAFGSRMFHGAHQLTRLRYSMDLTKHIEEARREAKNTSDPVRSGAIANEMQKRHDWTMNPTGAQWSAWATSAAFVWYLGLTPGAAIVNLTQTTVVGIPILAAGIKGGSVKNAAKHLSRSLMDFTAGLKKGDEEWSRGALTSGRISADERKALEAAYTSGALDKSQAHDIAAIGDSGVAYSAAREKAMRPIAFLFHHAERLNREVTFLAAYRMAKEAGMDVDAATVKAGDLTWDTHFNYENWSRPRVMQGDVARVALVFKQFQINMLYRLFRDTHQALKGESEDVRKQARAQLIGITGSMMLHAGITGTWGYALMMLLAGMFFEGGSDEAEEELKSAVVGMFGTGAGGMILKGVPGTLTGTDLTARIGMPELWFRSPSRQVEGRDAYYHIVDQALGAVPAIGLNMLRGVQTMSDGEIWRGAELMVPKAVRDQMRFMRYLNEGVTTYKGDPLLDDISAHDAIVQAIGFSPARVSERYEQNRRLMNMQTGIQNERRQILSDVTRYLREGTPISKRAMRKVEEFNAQYPTYPITRDTIERSLRARLRASQENEGGIRMNNNLEDQLRSMMAPSISN